MAADLDALLALQQRRTRRAQVALAAAEAVRRAALEAVARFDRMIVEFDATLVQERDQRIQAILDRPATAVSLARIGLQYEIGEDERAALAARRVAAREEALRADEAVEAARLVVNACMKREKKLEAAAEKVARSRAQLEDVLAEMELER